MALNPAIQVGVMTDSTPPVIMASACPRLIVLQASPTAWAPAAQAVATEMLGPLAPRWMDIIPGAMLPISRGMKKGLHRLGPFSRTVWAVVSSISRPPSPQPVITPTRGPFFFVDGQTGAFQSHPGTGHGKGDEPFRAFGILFRKELLGIETVYLAGDLGGEFGGVETCDFADAGPAFKQCRPGFLHADSKRRHQSQTGNDNPSFQQSVPFDNEN